MTFKATQKPTLVVNIFRNQNQCFINAGPLVMKMDHCVFWYGKGCVTYSEILAVAQKKLVEK